MKRKRLCLILLGAILPVFVCTYAWSLEKTINYQAIIKDSSGNPLNHPDVTLGFIIWSGAETTDPADKVWEEYHYGLSITDGMINLVLGRDNDLDDPRLFHSGSNLYLEVSVEIEAGSETLEPRMALTSVVQALYAVEAGNADTVDDLDSSVLGVPIGTIVDWYREPGSSRTIPDGWMICDGSLITDPESVVTGNVPDLRNRFIIGVVNYGSIGQQGGTENHEHSVDTYHSHSVTGGSHGHKIDVPNYISDQTTQAAADHYHTGRTDNAGEHNHNIGTGDAEYLYGEHNPSGEDENTVKLKDKYFVNGVTIDFPYGGTFTIHGRPHEHRSNTTIEPAHDHRFDTQPAGAHDHRYSLDHNHAAFDTSGNDGNHSHTVSNSGSNATETTDVNHLPPYYGLLKIMRIK